MLHYFGEELTGSCKNCSNCLDASEIVDCTREAIVFLQGVIESGQRFGEKLVIEMLHGSSTGKVKQFELDQKECFGRLKGVSLSKLEEISRCLQMEEYLIVTSPEYPILKVGARAKLLLEGEEPFEMKIRKKPMDNQEKDQKKDFAGKTAGRARNSLMANSDSIFERLRKIRLDIAREEKVPPYLIFSDKTLVEMCSKMPRTEEEMLEISGVGNHKLQKYGDAFLSVIREFK